MTTLKITPRPVAVPPPRRPPRQRERASAVADSDIAPWLDHLAWCVRRIRAVPAFAQARDAYAPVRATFRAMRDRGERAYAATYQEWVVGLAGIGADRAGDAVIEYEGRLYPARRMPFIAAIEDIKMDGVLIESGVATEQGVRANGYLRVIVAHLLLCPDDIRTARDFPEPYPWPFHYTAILQGGRVWPADPQSPLAVVEHPDATAKLSAVVGRVRRRLQAPRRGRPDGAYASSPPARKRRVEKENITLALGRVAHELHQQGVSDKEIVNHPCMVAERERLSVKPGTRGAVESADAVRNAREAYRRRVAADGRPVGRPRKG